MRHRFSCPLRWGDMDAYGHVNNVEFARYLEQARVDLMFDAAGDAATAALITLSEGVVVAELSIRYVTPLVYRPAPVAVDVWVQAISNASFTFGYVVHDDGGPTYATASSVMVPFDLAAGRPRRITAEERAVLERFLEPVVG